MDVRFYPAAAGDPASLDFAQCLGYYGYSKHFACRPESVLFIAVCAQPPKAPIPSTQPPST
ncbi:TOX3 isoform 5 [Pongo abelii]|uniref:TOX high mobility group box family member 3 n=2 Tax=Simiiformes TaxID=314293 RepID=A0A2K5QBR7_CEBIM|nr:TOX3 isoform 5 [Pongo abelii]